MNIRDDKWHAQLQISGVGTPSNHSGSIMGIIAEVLKQLQGINPRALASGDKEIVIRIRDKAFRNSKEFGDLDRVLDVEAGLDESETICGPNKDETHMDFMTRLLNDGLTPASAIIIAADWFDAEPPREIWEWMNDVKATRFRFLNASTEAFESASPSEYATLKAYVLDRFPTFCENITFRTA